MSLSLLKHMFYSNRSCRTLFYLLTVMRQMLKREVKVHVLIKKPDMLHITWGTRFVFYVVIGYFIFPIFPKIGVQISKIHSCLKFV